MAKKKASKKPPAAVDPLAWIVSDLRPLAVPAADLVPDPANARKHDAANLRAIASSLERFGQRTPLVAHRQTKIVLKGNGTLAAAQQLGRTHLAVVWVDDDPTSQRGYALADNRTAELASWDDAALASLLGELRAESPDLLDDLLMQDFLDGAGGKSPAGKGKNSEKPEAEPVPEQYQVIADCGTQAAQKALWEELSARGVKCRLLTL